VGGLLEDITKKVSPEKRLIFASVSAFLSVFLFGAYIYKLDIPLIDSLFYFTPLGILFTVFALVGLSNAYNIIDGFNGLASGVAIVVFTSFVYMVFIKDDSFLLSVSLVMLFAILGFFVLNFPFGKIFLGDGGAYFIGFVIGFLSDYLVFKHRDVSPWYPLVLSVYPVFETVFSIYRRKLSRKYRPLEPDALHLHTLIYRRLTLRLGLKNDVFRNSAVMPLLVIPYLPFVVIANLFWDKTAVLAGLSAVYMVIYLFIYRSIVRFKVKAWARR